MWDNPRLLNLAANGLIALALTMLGFAGTQALLNSPLFPLREVTVLGDLAHTTRDELESAARGRVAGNFFAADLASIRDALEHLPWVRRADVRRVWPDRIEVTLEEHVALARWGDVGLVNTYGERFAGQTEATLPIFAGPARTEGEVTRRYRRYAELLGPLGSALERVILTPRFAWQLRLANGLSIELGRDLANDPAEARLVRFVAAYPQTLGRIARRHEYVDLRYPNGFSLRVTDFGRDGTPKAKG
ncbi:MAG: cell division protein FtsQ/DivIB [Proteobacteria bacterium]|nr:cell division protein FtsQ/DivIB [Pseudomonadota bacterium]